MTLFTRAVRFIVALCLIGWVVGRAGVSWLDGVFGLVLVTLICMAYIDGYREGK